MKRMTKLLSLMLAALMLVGMLPLGVWAAGETHTVRFNLNYNGAPKLSDQKVADGKYATQPEGVVRDGWHFSYWYVKRGNNQIEKFDLATTPITTDVTLYARWTEDTLARAEKMAQGLELAKRMEEKEEENTENTNSIKLYSSTKELDTDTNSIVTFFANVTGNTDCIRLYNSTNHTFTEMYDDGTHGDGIKNDGIYTCEIELYSSEETELEYYAFATSEKIISNIILIKFIAPFTTKELDDMAIVDEVISELIAAIKTIESLEERWKLVESRLLYLASTDNIYGEALIVPDSIYYDREYHSVYFKYSCGIFGGIELDDSGLLLNSGNLGNDNIQTSPIIQKSEQPSQHTTAITAQKNAVIMYGWDDPFNNSNFIGEYQNYQVIWTQAGLNTQIRYLPTVESTKTAFLNKDFIVVAEHGGLWKHGLAWNTKTYVWGTMEAPNKTRDNDYRKDIKEKRICKFAGQYCITPDFISFYYEGKLTNSVIYMDNCMGFGNEQDFNTDLANAFINDCNAAAVYGYHNSVYIKYGISMMETIVSNLMAGSDTNAAMESAILKWGNTDTVYAHRYTNWNTENHLPATIRLLGNSSSKLITDSKPVYGYHFSVMVKTDNNVAISDASAILYNGDGSQLCTARTNSDGEISKLFFVSATINNCYLTVSKIGYEERTIYDVKPFQYYIDYHNVVLTVQNTHNISGKITIADEDTDMTNNLPLEGAEITIKITNYMEKVVTSNQNGEYELTDIPVGTYTITVTKEGFIPVTETITVGENDQDIIYNIAIEAIPETYNGIGYASGTIYDVATGRPVSGMTLYIRNGLENITGDVVAIIHMNDKYTYSTTIGLPAGNYTVQIVDERTGISEDARYITSSFNIKILGGMTIGNQNGYVSNKITAEEIRIVLTWGATPSDLDSHLVGPDAAGGKFHVYYYNKRYGSEVDLDVDDTSSYGPETITIHSSRAGTYTYAVHDYTNRSSSYSTALSNSGAQIKVYKGAKLIATYNVPANKDGTLWTVFTYDGATGQITTVNTMTYDSSSGGSLLNTVALRSVETSVQYDDIYMLMMDDVLANVK